MTSVAASSSSRSRVWSRRRESGLQARLMMPFQAAHRTVATVAHHLRPAGQAPDRSAGDARYVRPVLTRPTIRNDGRKANGSVSASSSRAAADRCGNRSRIRCSSHGPRRTASSRSVTPSGTPPRSTPTCAHPWLLPDQVAVAPGRDGLVQNRRAPASGTAVNATTRFGRAAHPASSTGAGVDANRCDPTRARWCGSAVRPGPGTARQTDTLDRSKTP
jgi:hypothetical protein